MTAFPADVLDRVKNAVCAIGYLRVPLKQYQQDIRAPHFVIVGTGFVVRPGIVITNRHVIRLTQQLVENEHLGEGQQYLYFDRPTADGKVLRYVANFRRRGWLETPTKDLGVIEFTPPDGATFGVCEPLAVNDALDLRVNQDVGIYGYAFGSTGLERDDDEGVRRVYRVGPVLQRGYISAIAPYDDSENVERIVMDIRTSESMSGAPVFEPYTGTVIGVHESGMKAVMAFAIPLTTALVDQLEGALTSTPPGTAGVPISIPVAKQVRKDD